MFLKQKLQFNIYILLACVAVLIEENTRPHLQCMKGVKEHLNMKLQKLLLINYHHQFIIKISNENKIYI